MSSITNFFGSSSFWKGASDIFNTAAYYNAYKQYNYAYNYNIAQTDYAQNSLLSNYKTDIINLNNWYKNEYENISDKGRSVIGKSETYYSTHGVELYGSAVQNIMSNLNRLQRSKDALYTDYLNKFNYEKSVVENKEYKYSILKSQYDYNKKMNKYKLYTNIGNSLLNGVLNE